MVATSVGFAGGRTARPTYERVCGKRTGHAEVVAVAHNLRQLTTARLLVEFFVLHDFSQDRRGNGGQYRSAIFLPAGGRHLTAQRRAAERAIDRLTAAGLTVSTEVREVDHFWPAGGRHQQYCGVRGLTPRLREAAEIRQLLLDNDPAG